MHHMHMISAGNIIIALIAAILTTAYLYLAFHQQWPFHRSVLWTAGVLMCTVVMLIPAMHHQFIMHMYGHLMLGMLGPLCLVLAKPLTLLLKTVPVETGRTISRVMNTGYVRLITHPVTAMLLNTGGLWLLYRTPLFMLMHVHMWLYYLIHLHIFLAGYLFTSVMLNIDPNRHPYSFKYRSVVMMISIALHQILSKSFYPYPPAGVDKYQAEIGAQVMYYGGGLIELIIIFLMCRSWYHSVRPGKQQVQ